MGLAELSSTAKAVSQLAAEPGLVDRLSHAIELGDCGLVQAALVSVGSTERCSIICHWACGWRAIRFCWPVCLPWFVREPQIADIDEMREFARATAVLVERPELLDKLDAFVSSGQRDEYLNLVKKLGLERYCLQLCHWLFYRVCRRLCRCECRAEDIPHWLRLETFDIHPAAGNPGASFSPEGYAEPGGGFYVFGGGVHLGGNSPLVDVATGNAIAYRFLFGEYTWNPPGDNPAALPSVAPAAMTPIKAEILPTLVGYLPYTDGNGVGQYQPVTIGPADADPDGWIQIDNKMITVPMYNPVGATAVLAISPSNWIRTFDLMVLNTAAITSQHPVKLAAGLIKADAGRSLTTAEEETIRRYRLVFEAKDNVSGAPIATDVLEAVIFDNSQVIWALDLEELRNDACNPLAGQAQAHILYTVDYPHLRSFGVSIGNNLGTVHPPVPAASGFPTVAMPSGAFASPDWYFRGGASGPHLATGNGGVAVNIATDPRCAYRVVLNWQTRRFGDLPGSTEILYCK